MKKYQVITLCVFVIVIVGLFGFCASSSSKPAEDDNSQDCPEVSDVPPYVHIITVPCVPQEVEFAGEALPLHLFDVRESLERELIVNMNFHSSTLQYLKRITRFFPVIEPILAANGIPDDFKYLALIESDFLYRVSPAGATGFWQFMRAAATDYGLEMSDEVDERYHLEKATTAACRYLRDAYRMFNNWTLVAASYNMGMAGLQSRLRQQQVDSYYDLWLSEETMRYVFRIAAVKLILTDPEKYGFHMPEEEMYRPIPFTEIKVDGAVTSWIDFALEHKTNYKMIRVLNPWIRDTKLTNRARKTYMVRIPAEGVRGVTE